MSDAIDTKDTKEAGDMLPAMTADEKMIQDGFNELLKDYLNSNHRRKVERITKAFNFANQAHAGVKRRSGEPYIMHPIAVARIVCREMGLGSTSICSALLHDVVEDTEYTVQDISDMFGPKIAQIVDGLTKISGGIFGEQASAQAENFRKLLLTMSDDIRVILIKIADRLHNMRTLGSMLPAKQFKIAGETLYLYAPLAHRLGLFTIKTELEDLSFKYEHPQEYDFIEQKLQASEESRNKLFEHFAIPVDKKLKEMGLHYEMKARVKSAYSIWNKMESKGITFEDIYDLYAVRIIFDPLPGVDEKNMCWDIYSAITDIYRIRPDRIRDWVSRPKANGYQALHLTVMGPDGQWVEIQIRSRRMDDIAEKGFAAHWKYKEGGGSEDEGELEKWLRTIKEILDDPQPDAMDFLDTIKLNLFASEIFVFTPKGEIKTMPQNCTALDFAFSIHTFLGSHCIGAKVNHKLVPLSHKLQSGDQVEILTSKSQHVQPSWINFATTAKAKAKIQAILKREQRGMQQAGEEMLREFFSREGVEYTPENIRKICNLHTLKTQEELFAAIGFKTIILGENDKNELKDKPVSSNWKKYISFAFGGSKTNKEKPTEEKVPLPKIDSKKILKLTPEAIQKNYVIAECCKPIPGDDVLGYIGDNNRIIIHKRQCPLATKLKSSYGNRLLAVQWETGKSLYFPVNIYIKGIDHIGLLNKVTEIISQQLNVNIHKLNIESNDGIFEGRIQLFVHDVDDVKSITTNLRKIDEIKTVTRIEKFEDEPN